jgi:hypothetical protein
VLLGGIDAFTKLAPEVWRREMERRIRKCRELQRACDYPTPSRQ